jgi:sterol desaturase/sphingolipid hydroxylase (fatty acid hydroxylase superfamily)
MSEPQSKKPTEQRRELIRRLGSSKFNYWFGYVANLTLVVWLGMQAWRGGRLALGVLEVALYATAGLLSWTLSEYLLHRYVYHVWRSFLSQGHNLHHERPQALIGVPWYLTTIALLAIFFGVSRVASPPVTGVVMAGNWLGYILYCLAHHGSHHFRYRSEWLRRMKRQHLIHHAHPNCNWGFTTSLWDRVFRTHFDGRVARAQWVELDVPASPRRAPLAAAPKVVAVSDGSS